jgi:hypothetical protein
MLRPRLVREGALLLLAAAGLASGASRGEYGFLSKFDVISPHEARQAVRQMRNGFGIEEFEFFNVFEGYSRPPDQNADHWFCACFHGPVNRSIVKTYVQEIAQSGGRSWLSIQAMGTDPADIELQRGFKVVGNHTVQNQVLMDIVAINSRWAERIVPRWIDFAVSLGFSGIHWSVLAAGGQQDVHGFLRAASPMLQARGLEQTMTFLNGADYDESLKPLIAFPIYENWRGGQEGLMMASMPKGSVYSSYPGKDSQHAGEVWNEKYIGMQPLDLIILRWQTARCHGLRYLAVGDGLKTLRTDYFPDSQYMNPEEVRRVRAQVFQGLTCGGGSHAHAHTTPAPNAQNPWERGCQGSARLGHLRFKVKRDEVDAVGILQESTKALETVIMGMFGFCRVSIHDVREMGRLEHFGPKSAIFWRRLAEEDTDETGVLDSMVPPVPDDKSASPEMVPAATRRTPERLSPEVRIEVTYQGICMKSCFEEPVDSPKHLTRSLQYGFDQEQIGLKVLHSALEVQRSGGFHWESGSGDTYVLGIINVSYLTSEDIYDGFFFIVMPIGVVITIALCVCIYVVAHKNRIVDTSP